MCLNPITIRKYQSSILPVGRVVPCGKCFECLQAKRAQWSFRLKQELKDCETATFLTLTHDENSVRNTEIGSKTLRKKDLQDYFKRVRTEAPKLRYYAVGEYGGKTRRPHYHAIVYDADNAVLVSKWGKWTGTVKELFGNVRCDEVTEASIHYVTGYLMDKDGSPDKQTSTFINKGIDTETGEVWLDETMEQPFSIMSKGLGKCYLIAKDYHKSNLTLITNEQGQKGILPRYYKDKMFNEMERTKLAKMQMQEQKRKNQQFSVKKAQLKKQAKYQIIINAKDKKKL